MIDDNALSKDFKGEMTRQGRRPTPFAALPRTPREHFALYFYAAVLQVLNRLGQPSDSSSEALARFPFLAGYCNELAEQGLAGVALDDAARWWHDRLEEWEQAAAGHLPLRALREAAGLDHAAMTLLFSVGLIEEDVRFGALYEALQGTPGQHRPTVGLLYGWWPESADKANVRTNIRRLQELGLVDVVNLEAPRAEWAMQVPSPVWDALRGEAHATPAPGLYFHAPEQLCSLDELILPGGPALAMIPPLLRSGEAQAVIVRGPQHNGRRTVLGALARSLDCGLLEIDGLRLVHDDHGRWIGSLATLLHAMPVVVTDPGPGETDEIPRLAGYTGPAGVVLGREGGVNGPGVERALTVMLDVPTPHARRQHWLRGLQGHPVDDLDAISTRFRMTSGNVHRATQLAQAYAALNGNSAIMVSDVQQASRTLNRQALDTLAMRLPTTGDWSSLAVDAETQRELHSLEQRCRHREQLRGAVGPALGARLNCGVRALLSGPSGTGKTLAARLLASVLQMDLYRLNLAAVVNKYIGETEKNLNQVLSRAEELDVILLLDEGDALLTQRTNVQTSNDRYANLETDFLLQRLESFEGVLIVTTNTAERIDSAFQRRMDVVIDFRPPDVAERWAIWQLHLPTAHAVDQRVLQEVAGRCALNGGQIRNAVVHASLLALDKDGVMTTDDLVEAVQREYRKIGAVCPLRKAWPMPVS